MYKLLVFFLVIGSSTKAQVTRKLICPFAVDAGRSYGAEIYSKAPGCSAVTHLKRIKEMVYEKEGLSCFDDVPECKKRFEDLLWDLSDHNCSTMEKEIYEAVESIANTLSLSYKRDKSLLYLSSNALKIMGQKGVVQQLTRRHKKTREAILRLYSCDLWQYYWQKSCVEVADINNKIYDEEIVPNMKKLSIKQTKEEKFDPKTISKVNQFKDEVQNFMKKRIKENLKEYKKVIKDKRHKYDVKLAAKRSRALGHAYVYCVNAFPFLSNKGFSSNKEVFFHQLMKKNEFESLCRGVVECGRMASFPQSLIPQSFDINFEAEYVCINRTDEEGIERTQMATRMYEAGFDGNKCTNLEKLKD